MIADTENGHGHETQGGVIEGNAADDALMVDQGQAFIPGNDNDPHRGIHLPLWVTKDILVFLEYHRSLNGLRGEKASHFSQKYGNIERVQSLGLPP